ncbi:CynX/NimT family MFS transporter [Microbacterium sp. YJN-G]|uniref:MFS transporter n=1 Tax=Microbacterium sp. YJN-G TaxID=2763257 RepID=UPI001878B422|nr:MFS transporter [Microbacterium sp. YJN-G]
MRRVGPLRPGARSCAEPEDHIVTPPRSAAAIGIALAALNLRTAVASLSPIIDFVVRDVPLSTAAIIVLGMLPPLCFAAGALITPAIANAVGVDRAAVASLGALALGLAVRGLAPDDSWLIIGSTTAFLCIGVLNVLLPPLVKKHFSDRIGPITSLYTTLMAVGTFLPPLTVVPLAHVWGWRAALLVWCALAVAALVPWILVARGASDEAGAHPRSPVFSPALARSPITWGVTALCATAGFIAYAIFAWYPLLLADTTALDAGSIGMALAVYAAMGAPASFVLPAIVARYRAVGSCVLGGGAMFAIAFCGMLIAPQDGIWIWAVLGGAGQLMFPLSLVLINLRTRTMRGSVALSTVVQSAGYLVAATGPLVLGLLHAATGGWNAALLMLVVVALIGTGLGLLAARSSWLEDSVKL